MVSYSGGRGVGGGEGYPPNLSFLPLDFRPNIFQHAATSQLQAFRGPRSYLKQPQRAQNLKKISWGVYPQTPLPPRSSVLRMIDSFPSLTKNRV